MPLTSENSGDCPRSENIIWYIEKVKRMLLVHQELLRFMCNCLTVSFFAGDSGLAKSIQNSEENLGGRCCRNKFCNASDPHRGPLTHNPERVWKESGQSLPASLGLWTLTVRAVWSPKRSLFLDSFLDYFQTPGALFPVSFLDFSGAPGPKGPETLCGVGGNSSWSKSLLWGLCQRSHGEASKSNRKARKSDEEVAEESWRK